MKVKMIKTHAGPSGCHVAGRIYSLPEKLAQALIGTRAAKEIVPVAEAVKPKVDEQVCKDLEAIDGISKAAAKKLADQGVTIESLAVMDEASIKAVIKVTGLTKSAKHVDSWAEQAKAQLAE